MLTDKRAWTVGLGLCVATFSSPAAALRIALPRPQQVQGQGTALMSIGVFGPEVRAKVCAAAPCDASQGQPLSIPEPFASAVFGAVVRTLTLARGQRAALVQVSDRDGRKWVSLVMPPTRATDGPRVVFAGVADVAGEGAAGAPSHLHLVPSGDHVDVVIGAQDPAVDLCGRPAVLSAKLLDPTTGELRPAKLQRLDEAERRGAARVIAVRAAEGSRRPLGRLLVATGASSALGSPSALTDGDPTTAWAESRGGDGHGEFITTRAPRDVPISSLRIVVSPPTVARNAAAPRRLYVVTDRRVFDVVLPEDGVLNPGRAYVVTFDAPVATSCVAVSLEESYPSRDGATADVTLAEVEAESEVERGRSPAELIELLSTGNAEARAAAGVLMRANKETRALVADRYESLDFAGRLLALDIADQGPCEDAAPLYVRALTSKDDGELRHARTRLERCRKKAVPALVQAASDNTHPAQVRAADELGLISPEDAATALGRAITSGGAPARKRLGGLLGRAFASPRTDAAAVALLSDTKPPVEERLRLLSIASRRLSSPEVAAAARDILRASDASFETRYLALPARAALAARGDDEATTAMRRELTAAEAPIRARAAALSGEVPALRTALLAATRDGAPRVRAAAAGALGRAGVDGVADIQALFVDDWTFVRTAAYQATTSRPAVAFDDALIARLSVEPSPLALSALVDALAERGNPGARGPLRALLRDTARSPDVRARAVRGAAMLCDAESIDALVALAKGGSHAMANEGERVLAGAAVAALGRLHPPDLASRLSFLRGEGVPGPLVAAARSAMAEKDVCPTAASSR